MYLWIHYIHKFELSLSFILPIYIVHPHTTGILIQYTFLTSGALKVVLGHQSILIFEPFFSLTTPTHFEADLHLVLIEHNKRMNKGASPKKSCGGGNEGAASFATYHQHYHRPFWYVF